MKATIILVCFLVLVNVESLQIRQQRRLASCTVSILRPSRLRSCFELHCQDKDNKSNVSNIANEFNQKFVVSTSSASSASSSVQKAGINDKDKGKKGGPLTFVQRMAMIVFLSIKVCALSISAKMSKYSPIKFKFNPRKGGSSSKLLKLADMLGAIIQTKLFWARISVGFFSGGLLRKYLAFTRSLTTEVSFPAFMDLLSKHPEKVQRLRVTATSFLFTLDGKHALTRMVTVSPHIMDKLLASGVDFSAPPTPVNVLSLIWTGVYCAFLYNVSTRMMSGPQDEGAGKRKEKSLASLGLSFADIAGQERAKQEVQEVCTMLKNPQAYSNIGARLPAGVLMVGPPGTGKTLLARVAAAEAEVPFYSCSATDFVEVFVGRGPARVRKLFKDAAENAPAIVFIDEIDSLGRSRRMGSLNSEQENTLNQLLTSMDGLDTSNNGVIVMAATNRYELLDPALLRAGRFDRIIQCPLPDRAGRLGIFKVHTRKLKLDANVDLDRLARVTGGSCGADLSAIVNEAAIRTARRGGSSVSEEDFEDAVRSFYSGRGLPLAGIAEAANNVLPSWLGGAGGRGDEGRPASAM